MVCTTCCSAIISIPCAVISIVCLVVSICSGVLPALCCISIIPLLILALLVVILIVTIPIAFCFTVIDYIYPTFSSAGVVCKPAADCVRNAVNTIQFQTYPETIRDLCGV